MNINNEKETTLRQYCLEFEYIWAILCAVQVYWCGSTSCSITTARNRGEWWVWPIFVLGL